MLLTPHRHLDRGVVEVADRGRALGRRAHVEPEHEHGDIVGGAGVPPGRRCLARQRFTTRPAPTCVSRGSRAGSKHRVSAPLVCACWYRSAGVPRGACPWPCTQLPSDVALCAGPCWTPGDDERAASSPDHKRFCAVEVAVRGPRLVTTRRDVFSRDGVPNQHMPENPSPAPSAADVNAEIAPTTHSKRSTWATASRRARLRSR